MTGMAGARNFSSAMLMVVMTAACGAPTPYACYRAVDHGLSPHDENYTFNDLYSPPTQDELVANPELHWRYARTCLSMSMTYDDRELWTFRRFVYREVGDPPKFRYFAQAVILMQYCYRPTGEHPEPFDFPSPLSAACQGQLALGRDARLLLPLVFDEHHIVSRVDACPITPTGESDRRTVAEYTRRVHARSNRYTREQLLEIVRQGEALKADTSNSTTEVPK
jgi:hypothetical protein